MSKRLDYNYIKEYFESQNYKLLSDTYTSVEDKLECECPEGHKFQVSFHNFKGNGTRCPVCNNKKGYRNNRNTIEYVRQVFENNGFTLISKEYKNNRQKLECKCQEGHTRFITFCDFLSGVRCKECFDKERGKSKRLSIEYVRNYFSSQKYTLVSDTYKNSAQKLDVVCPEGHSWSVSFNNFKDNNCRCAKCPTVVSKGEAELYKFIKLFFENSSSSDRTIISPLELDVVIPDKKIGIEYCGIYWHSEDRKKDKNYHLNKLNRCNEINYRLITIFEDEWYSRKDIVKSALLSILGISSSKVIYARDCIIREIQPKEARQFCEDNHLQGYHESLIKLGAFLGDRLVSVMTFSRPNISRNVKNEEGVFELTRFCSDKDLRVVGIASKLLKFFEDNVDCKYVFSYSDRRWFEGGLYEKLGFAKERTTPPSYWYVKNNSYKRYHRFTFRKDVLKDFNGFGEGLTEQEIMKKNGYKIIWDCGTIRWGKLF